ncbi:hypothetical protein Tco_1191151 [Tanacetum coccineum]
MAFIITTFALRYPWGNATGTEVYRNIGNSSINQSKVIWCYNFKGEGHMARRCTQPNRPKNSEWFKEKMLLAQALESGIILDEEQLAFLADPGDRVDSSPYTQTLPTTVIFHTDDLDAFDSDCNEALSASAVLMAKLFAYDSDVLSDIPN